MSFEKLILKVASAEDAVEANERRTGADLRQLKDSWASMWSPGRIVIAGLAGGFLIGRAEPLQTVARSGGLLRMASTLMTLFSGATAASVAESAEHAGVAAGAASAAAETLRNGASERVAHDYLERLAAAARQAGSTGES